MAHTKAGGSTKLGRDSQSKRLGVKLFGDQVVSAGGIIVRQRGSKMVAGPGTLMGKDHTIFAARAGQVGFATKKVEQFTGSRVRHTVVSVTDK
jgi:large subunit ribosomal protein L27